MIDGATAIQIARAAAMKSGLDWDGDGRAIQTSLVDRLPWIGDGARWVVVSSRGKGKQVRVRLNSCGKVVHIGYTPR